ncbi:MAG TPA: putative baseplate assembly protein [Solirubrobacteraceae bacterium]|nr:putative baseplate assembly protein [Solirubrobacteraceae bacterium]
MRLPEIELDDRGFQELVSEARTRIARRCPEWTEHNVSDPGITLIELFAWMTEMTTYRLNRVPDKIYVRLLELLGVPLRPPTPAQTHIRFLLSAPPIEPVSIIAADTEVGTVRTTYEESVVFEVAESRIVEPLAPAVFVVHRDGLVRDIAVDAGVARPVGADRAAFSAVPLPGDAIHLGFEDSLSRLLLRIDVEAQPARGAGVDPRRPPLRWEMATGERAGGDLVWERVTVLDDTTGGFNFGSGELLLELAGDSQRLALDGHRMHWLRCRVASPQEAGEAAYERPPEIATITATPMGATLLAQHAEHVDNEILGESDGTPGQSFTVLRPPMLAASDDEWLEVRHPVTGDWQRWGVRESFVDCGPDDRCYSVDAATGTIDFGPAVRQSDGAWRHYGAIPPKGAALRLSRYRYGGGLRGNVAPNTLTVLKSGPAGVAAVTNPTAARGGVDPEPLDSVRLRGAMELRTRHRAVTAEDFEHLAREASPRVARAVCVPPVEGNAIAVRILPRVHPADRRLNFDELQPSRRLLYEVAGHLDDRRLLGAMLQVAPVRLRGVSIVVELQTEPLADLVRIREQTLRELYRFLNPLIGGLPGAEGTGWEFGRTLNQGELYGVVHSVPGVEYVRLLRMYRADLVTGRQAPEPAGSHIVLEPDETIASGVHIVKAAMRGT